MADAIVRIWWFAWRGAQALGGGHGSVELPPPYRAYITWLDGDARDQLIAGTWDRNDDLVQFQHCPDPVQVTIGLRDEQSPCGLDAAQMVRWWALWRQRAPRYKMLSKSYNCDASVVSALRAGGAEVYAPAPSNLIYQGAATLLKWVNALSHRIEELNALCDHALLVLQKASNEPWNPNIRGAPRPEIWTVAEWKTWSALTLGTRKEQVASIDRLLAQYHSTPAANIAERYDLLSQMLALATEHLVRKPTSARRPAVMKLGRQLYDKTRELEGVQAPGDSFQVEQYLHRAGLRF